MRSGFVEKFRRCSRLFRCLQMTNPPLTMLCICYPWPLHELSRNLPAMVWLIWKPITLSSSSCECLSVGEETRSNLATNSWADTTWPRARRHGHSRLSSVLEKINRSCRRHKKGDSTLKPGSLRFQRRFKSGLGVGGSEGKTGKEIGENEPEEFCLQPISSLAWVAGKIRRGDQQDPLPVLLGYRQVRRIYLREGPYLLREAVPCGENTLFRSQPLSRLNVFATYETTCNPENSWMRAQRV